MDFSGLRALSPLFLLRRQQDDVGEDVSVCRDFEEGEARKQEFKEHFLKAEIVIWVSGRNVLLSPPLRCLYSFSKPQQLLPLHQSLVSWGWQRAGGFPHPGLASGRGLLASICFPRSRAEEPRKEVTPKGLTFYSLEFRPAFVTPALWSSFVGQLLPCFLCQDFS